MTRLAVSPDSRFKHAPNTAWRRIEDEAVILDLRTSVYFSLNDTAAFIWERVGDGLPAEEIAALVTEDFEQTLESARRDVLELLRELHKNELIVPA